MAGAEMTGWLVAGAVAAYAFWRGGRWRRWTSGVAASVAAERRDDSGRWETFDASWNDEQESLVRGLEKWASRVADAEREVGRLAGVIDGMVEGVVVIDGDGRVVLANSQAEQLLDLPSGGEHAGRLLAELSRHPDLHEMVGLVREEGEWEQPIVQEVVVGTSQNLTLQVTASRLTAREDMERWFVLVFHDISSIRRLERMRRDFVANVSHELRTPLAAIGGYTETLLEGAKDDPEKVERFLRIIERHSDRLGRLVNDLLTLSDLELGRTELRREAQDLSRVVDACFDTLRSKAKGAGVTLEMAVDGHLPAVDADADRLEQALLNLIDNAIKYTPRGGHVRVAAKVASSPSVPDSVVGEPGARFVELEVTDTGVGVPPEDLARLTERFYRVDKARSRELGGTGLGLAIVKHIVQAHGGWLTIDSELHRGTTVRMFLPAHEEREEAE